MPTDNERRLPQDPALPLPGPALDPHMPLLLPAPDDMAAICHLVVTPAVPSVLTHSPLAHLHKLFRPTIHATCLQSHHHQCDMGANVSVTLVWDLLDKHCAVVPPFNLAGINATGVNLLCHKQGMLRLPLDYGAILTVPVFVCPHVSGTVILPQSVCQHHPDVDLFDIVCQNTANHTWCSTRLIVLSLDVSLSLNRMVHCSSDELLNVLLQSTALLLPPPLWIMNCGINDLDIHAPTNCGIYLQQHTVSPSISHRQSTLYDTVQSLPMRALSVLLVVRLWIQPTLLRQAGSISTLDPCVLVRLILVLPRPGNGLWLRLMASLPTYSLSMQVPNIHGSFLLLGSNHQPTIYGNTCHHLAGLLDSVL